MKRKNVRRRKCRQYYKRYERRQFIVDWNKKVPIRYNGQWIVADGDTPWRVPKCIFKWWEG